MRTAPISALLVLALGAGTANAITWSSMFPAGSPLTGGECVRVLGGTTVQYDVPDRQILDVLWIEDGARFEFEDSGNRTLEAAQIIVDGAFAIGAEGAGFTHEADIRLVDASVCSTVYDIDSSGVIGSALLPDDFHQADANLNRTLLVRGGDATLDLHGQAVTYNWKTIRDHNVNAGDTLVTLYDHASLGLPDFAVGDRVVLTSSDFDMEQVDVRRIDAITSLGTTPPRQEITLDAGVDYLHFTDYVGTSHPGVADVRERTQIGLLSHNIRIFAPTPGTPPQEPNLCATEDLYFDGAEIRIVVDDVDDSSPAHVRIDSVEMKKVGKYGRMGRYPIHFHELGDMSGSYVRRTSIRRSANRAIVIHGSQGVELYDNVAYGTVGHAYYLERTMMMMPTADNITAHNTLERNLGLSVYSCNPLETTDGSAVFYFEDARNVFIDNVAAGSEHSGFYYDHRSSQVGADGLPLDSWNLCAADAIDYQVTDSVPLDLGRLSYGDHASSQTGHASSLYADRGYDDGTGTVQCHGTFQRNQAHSTFNGFWGWEHQNSVVRLHKFKAWKIEDKAVAIKNKGFTEIVSLRVADVGTAIWPGSHAYHLGYTPRWLVAESHFVGQSANIGDPAQWDADEAVLGRSQPYTPAGVAYASIYGVEVYEGQLRIADSFFEAYTPIVPTQTVAALGRHQSFPNYSNNPNNSIIGVEVDPASVPVWFDDPGRKASGETSVMIHDVDASVSGVPAWITANDDFVVDGLAGPTHASFQSTWNAHTIDATAQQYGQLLVTWCDTLSGPNPPYIGPECDTHGGPTSVWQQARSGEDVYGAIRGLDMAHTNEGHVLRAEHHRPLGTHSRLAGNVLAGGDYEVTFWADLNGTTPIATPATELTDVHAIEVQLRYAPAGTQVTASVQFPCEPAFVQEYVGEAQDPANMTDITGGMLLGGTPGSRLEWGWDDVVDRATVWLETSTDWEEVAVLLHAPIGGCP